MKDIVWYHCVIREFSKASKPRSVLSLQIAGMALDRGVFLTLGKIFESYFSPVLSLGRACVSTRPSALAQGGCARDMYVSRTCVVPV